MAPGWPEDNVWGDRQIALADAGVDALVRQGIPFANAPGVAFEYSNLAYMILGRIVHRAAGISALTYITENLLRPLGMTATVWNAAAAPTPVANGYRWEDHQWRERSQRCPPTATRQLSVGSSAPYATLRAGLPSSWPPGPHAMSQRTARCGAAAAARCSCHGVLAGWP